MVDITEREALVLTALVTCVDADTHPGGVRHWTVASRLPAGDPLFPTQPMAKEKSVAKVLSNLVKKGLVVDNHYHLAKSPSTVFVRWSPKDLVKDLF